MSLGCFHYFHTKVRSQIAFGEDLCHVGTSKLICETNLWTGPCIWFLPEGRSKTMIYRSCGSGKYTTVLCFSIQGGYSRVPAQSRTSTLVVEGFLECSLCWIITGLWCVWERVYMVFTLTTERFFEVAIESWPECNLNPRPLHFVQTL